MKTRWFALLLVVFCLVSTGVSAAELDQEQTETWLTRHIEAWDDNSTPRVRVQECVINRITSEKNDVLNIRGIILPIEIIQVGSASHAVVRVRVRDPHSGTFAMSRECNQRNSRCAGGEGDFVAERYLDFRITYERDYAASSDRNLTLTKARHLRCALRHYAMLCNPELEEEESDTGFCS